MSRPERIAGTDGRDRPFDAPWHAEVFAMVQALVDRGVFSAREWTTALAAKRGRPGLAPDGSDYWVSFLCALEALLAEKGKAEPAEVDACAAAWQRAAHATPHGRPILLENDPQGAGRLAPATAGSAPE